MCSRRLQLSTDFSIRRSVQRSFAGWLSKTDIKDKIYKGLKEGECIMERLGFIGMGNMAQALCAGFVNSGKIAAESVYAYAPHYDKLVKSWWMPWIQSSWHASLIRSMTFSLR